MAAPARILLVEITNADQFPGQIRRDLPFVAGFLSAHGCGLRWLRFGVSTLNQLRHGRDEVTFEPTDLATLLAAVREHRPSRVLTTHPLAPEQRALVRQAAPRGARVVLLTTELPPDLVPGAVFRPEDGLEGGAWRPTYTWELSNRAGEAHDNVALLLRSQCGYARPLSENPCYRELVAEGLPLIDGCAFCGNASQSREATPVDWLRRQVRALAADRGVARAPKALLSEHLGGRVALEALTGTLHETGLDRVTTLCFGIRTDALRRLEPVLRAHLLANPAARLGVYATGLESFVAADLERFHKGTTPADGLAAVEALRGLARDFPGRFTSTGLTMILFTPWTTPADLLTNLHQVEALGLADEIGNLFAARLRLHPERAISALARRDGLVVADEPDPLLVSNRRKLFGHELPWRFADPRLAPLCRIYVRLDEATALADDALSVRVREASRAALGRPGHDWMTRKLALLIACAEEVAALPTPLSEAELLARGARRLAAESAASATGAGAAGLRVAFRPRRGRAPGLAFRLAPADPEQPAYRRVGALALSYEPCPQDATFQRLAALVEAAASRTPPPLTDAAAWQRRLEALLDALGLARTYRVEATPAIGEAHG